jgi:hypothetical protein
LSFVNFLYESERYLIVPDFETAALVSQEVQRMQESIAELENLLVVQEEEEEEHQQQSVDAVGVHEDVNNSHVVFPALPAVVGVRQPNHRSQADYNRSNISNSSNDNEVPYTTDE